MVLLVGPRQAGKTWLSRDIASSFSETVYLNYDQIKDRPLIQNQSWIPSTELIILDEIHKMPDWKNYLKGVVDTKMDHQHILVTGSARLDVYDHLGDALAGRYFKHRLLPLSLAELAQEEEGIEKEIGFHKLLERGGFPEPYFAETNVDALRWRDQYINSLLSTDVFEFEKIYNLKNMRLLFDLLRHNVGSLVSYSSLARDIQVSPATVKRYIQILEALYIIFVVHPYHKNIARSILKEPKIYFFDTGLVEGGAGPRVENLVAVSLLKSLYAKADILAEHGTLHYLRTKEGHEVDFAIAKKDVVDLMIEVKQSDESISSSLKWFHEKYGYPAVQIVGSLRHEYEGKGISVLKAEKFLKNLYL